MKIIKLLNFLMNSFNQNNCIKKPNHNNQNKRKYNVNPMKKVNKAKSFLTSSYKKENKNMQYNVNKKNNNNICNASRKAFPSDKTSSKNIIFRNKNNDDYDEYEKYNSAKKIITVNRNIINKNDKYKKYCIKKLKFIQLWWKTIYQMIKIQKVIRGFLYRKKLILNLDRTEKLYDISSKLCIYIRKIFCKRAFSAIVKSSKMKLIKITKSKKYFYTKTNSSKKLKKHISKNSSIGKNIGKTNSINKFDNDRTLSLRYYYNTNNNSNSIDKKSKIKKFKKDNNNNKINKEIYRTKNTTTPDNKTTIIKKESNLITIINNTNNIYNNIINHNNNNGYKHFIKRTSFPKRTKLKISDNNLYNTASNNNKISKKIMNKISRKEIENIKIYKYFIFWKIKNTKKLLIKRLHSIYLIYKCISKIGNNFVKKQKIKFFNKLKFFFTSLNEFLIIKKYFNYYRSYINKQTILNKLKKYKQKSNLFIGSKYYKSLKNYNSSVFSSGSKSMKFCDNIINISIDLTKGKDKNNKRNNVNHINMSGKLTKKNSYNNSYSKRNNNMNKNQFRMQSFFSKTNKDLISFYHRNKNNDIYDQYNDVKTRIKQNTNYSKDCNDISNYTNLFNNTNTINLNDSLIEFQKNYIYHKKKVSRSKSSLKKNKKYYNNSCCFLQNESYEIGINNENRIEEKQIFFNQKSKDKENVDLNINLNSINNISRDKLKIKINRNELNAKKNKRFHNNSVIEINNCLSKKNSFYQKFSDIIHSPI